MRFMMIVQATEDSEAGVLPSEEQLTAMMQYNMELQRAGVLLAADGLQPSSGGIRISYPEAGGKPKITDGPFTEAKELIAGYTLIEVKSREEAIEWAMRMPDPHGYGAGQIELRQVFEPNELTDNPDSQAKHHEMRDQLKRQSN